MGPTKIAFTSVRGLLDQGHQSKSINWEMRHGPALSAGDSAGNRLATSSTDVARRARSVRAAIQ